MLTDTDDTIAGAVISLAIPCGGAGLETRTTVALSRMLRAMSVLLAGRWAEVAG